MVVSCPHKCSVQTLLRSEVRGVAGPVQELGILQDPAPPLKLRSAVFTGCDSDTSGTKTMKTLMLFLEVRYFRNKQLKATKW